MYRKSFPVDLSNRNIGDVFMPFKRCSKLHRHHVCLQWQRQTRYIHNVMMIMIYCKSFVHFAQMGNIEKRVSAAMTVNRVSTFMRTRVVQFVSFEMFSLGKYFGNLIKTNRYAFFTEEKHHRRQPFITSLADQVGRRRSNPAHYHKLIHIKQRNICISERGGKKGFH